MLKIELVKIDTIWKILDNDTLIIKQRSIDNLFDKVLTVNRGTIISENPKKYEKYSNSQNPYGPQRVNQGSEISEIARK